MQQKVNGNISGVRDTLLEEMRALYDIKLESGVFASFDLLSRMAAFTGMDYRIAAGLYNVLLILVMYVSAFLILKKVTTIRTTAVYMALLLTNPSFYAYASYYYTDTISAGLVMAAVCFIIYGCYKKKITGR